MAVFLLCLQQTTDASPHLPASPGSPTNRAVKETDPPTKEARLHRRASSNNIANDFYVSEITYG